MVPAVAGGGVREGQLLGARDNDGQRFQQTLRIAVKPYHRFAPEAGHKPLQGGGAALGRLDGPGLGPVLVYAEHDQSVGQFGVDFGRRGGHEQRDGPLDAVAAGA
jgi:hypothetical protein